MRKPKLIDLNDAVQHPGRHVEYDVSTSLDEEEDIDLLEPIEGLIDAVSTGNLLMVKGDFTAKVVMECVRCLKPVTAEVKFVLDEEFPVEGTPAGFGNRDYAEVKEVDEPSPLFEHNQLRYEDLIRQNLWLSLPLRPLCSEACKGIGHSDDDGEHGRPEFSALKGLLEDDK